LQGLHTDLFGPGQTDPLAPVQLEVIDRATHEALERLLAAGLITRTTRASRQLFPPAGPDRVPDALSAEELARAKAHRERAARQLKMARVLGEGGFGPEARPALLESVSALAAALAVEHRLPEPGAVQDALRPPLALHWAETLPALRTFVQEMEADWRPVAEALGRL
jgi:hypothetical protein